MQQQLSPAALPEPMPVTRLMDRAIRLFPKVARRLLPLLLLAAWCGFLKTLKIPPVTVAATIIHLLLGFYIPICGTFVAAGAWLGTETTFRAARAQTSFRLMRRFFGIGLWMVGGMLLPCVGAALILYVVGLPVALAVLGIIPGLIYMSNRLLAGYVLVLENSTLGEAMRKSKFLMTRGRWYSPRSPYMRLSALMLLTMVFAIGIGALTGGLNAVNVSAKGGLYVEISYLLTFTALLLTELVSIFGYLCFVGFYYDLRARYEGADMMAEVAALYRQGGSAAPEQRYDPLENA